jgi:arylsulfatase A-like enzyme
VLPDLVFLLCDTARADAFSPWGGPRRTPTVERLCAEGTPFRSAIAPAPWTVPSTASIFTGRLPTEHGVGGECIAWAGRAPTSPAACVEAFEGEWLPEALRERGYRTWGASCNSWVSRWGGFDRGFDEFLDVRPWARLDTHTRARARSGLAGRLERLGVRARYRASRAMGRLDRGAAAAAAAFEARLDAGGGEREPLFAFVNLMETHVPLDPPSPWYPYRNWRRLRTVDILGEPDQGLSYNAGLSHPDSPFLEILRTLYYSCAAYEDSVLARFVAAVERAGRPAVVVLLADHGEGLGERGLFGHNSSLDEAVLHVPLAVWGHGLRTDLAGGWVEEPFALTGLAGWARAIAEGADPSVPAVPSAGPVVSEYEGTAAHNGLPDHVRGRIAARREKVPPLVLHPGIAARDGTLKYVATGDGGEHAYDLADAGGEDRDLAPSRPDLLARLSPVRDAWLARLGARRAPSAEGDAPDAEVARHLRELGYIE